MTIYALTSLLSSVVALFLGTLIFFKDTKSVINRLFFVFSLFVSMYSFLEYGYRQSRSFEEANFWWQFDFLWPVHIACWLHLAAAITERKKWLGSWIFHVLVYGPAAIFAALDFFGHKVTGPPALYPWGWSYTCRENLFSTLSLVWVACVPLITSVLYIWYIRHIIDDRKLKQARLLLIGGVFPMASQIFEIGNAGQTLSFPPTVMIGFLLLNIIVAYAIWKYELFTLTPSKVAESIIATMGDSLMLVGLDTLIISSNQATTRMLGYSENSLKGTPVQKLFAPGAPMPQWLKATESNDSTAIQSNDFETEYFTIDGSHIPVSLSGSLLNDENGHLRGYLLIARDITEQRKAADEIARHRERLEELVEERTHQLSQTNVKLQQEINERIKAETEKKDLQEQLYQAQKMEAIGRLAGGVAHDFNNLLFVINGYAETLMADHGEDEQSREDISQILEAGSRAVNLTRQLLAFSRKQIIDPVVIDINKRIESSVKMLSRMIGEDVQIDFTSSLQSGKVIMDITQLDQIIANLLVNARDAMPTGGAIHIQTSLATLTESDVSQTPDRIPGQYIVIIVRDTGCGIAPDKLKMIFEPFYTSKDVGKGTGLGLATVYGIVKQNEGFIEVQSELNCGTEFQIYIPRAGASTLDNHALWVDAVTTGGTETILLVEDEHLVRRLATRQLESAGYRVLQAIDAQTALDIYYKFETEIDLLLTDVVMPGMSGVQMVEQISKRARRPKVIFMSGHNDEIIDKHGIRKTRHALLSKPFSSQQLCDKIREVIDSKDSVLSTASLKKGFSIAK
ncbi:MAG: response regulator [Deltaproteobacteria bacterium]|nr:response regulator [Deltaproteobacteria bacterium]